MSLAGPTSSPLRFALATRLLALPASLFSGAALPIATRSLGRSLARLSGLSRLLAGAFSRLLACARLFARLSRLLAGARLLAIASRLFAGARLLAITSRLVARVALVRIPCVAQLARATTKTARFGLARLAQLARATTLARLLASMSCPLAPAAAPLLVPSVAAMAMVPDPAASSRRDPRAIGWRRWRQRRGMPAASWRRGAACTGCEGKDDDACDDVR
ncbi:MAG: hypothetical protein KC503_33645 [Myxococcales bacterium]|nr:hypothetical protein [Myxococcales bacterium]